MSQNTAVHKNPYHVQSVGRALLIVELLAEAKREMSLTEISKKMGWPKSTVHGLISTMRDFQIVEQSTATGRYKLGVRLFELGNIVSRSWDVSAAAKPYMQALNAALGEMVQLATERDGEVLYLDKYESNRMIRIVSDIGMRLPMHCSGLGKVLLAYKSDAEVKRIISQKGLKRMTSRTICGAEELAKELKKVRAQGYAMDDREIMEGLRCVAVPIFDVSSQAAYALSVSGLYSVMQGDYLEKVIRQVKKAAESISAEMGFRKSELR
ncbi:MAG TPA: IclR family transcriptional regulator [Ruminococcaceae bacterium]|nr:IclR family transcriptional regulator [Oscillospiraceae bacterium]